MSNYLLMLYLRRMLTLYKMYKTAIDNFQEVGKMKMKTLVSLALIMALAVLTLAGCTGAPTTTAPTTTVPTTTATPTTTEPANPLLVGRFEWKNPPVDLETYIHFNEDGTYYGFFFGGGVIEAGLYELLDESFEYSVSGGADENFDTPEDNEKATASQVVLFKSYDGKEQKGAYVDGEIRDISLGGMSNHQTMMQNAEFVYDITKEQPVVVAQYYLGGEAGSNLVLYHDKTFADYTGDMGEEGTWVMNDDGSFTLTSTDNNNAEYTLVRSDKGAAYTKNGETLELSASAGEAAVISFKVEGIQVGLPIGVDMHIDCFADGTVKAFIFVAAVNADIEVDKGTYTVAEIFKYTFNFETAGEIAGVPDFGSATASSIDVDVPYKADVVGSFGGNDTPMSIDTTLRGTVTTGK